MMRWASKLNLLCPLLCGMAKKPKKKVEAQSYRLWLILEYFKEQEKKIQKMDLKKKQPNLEVIAHQVGILTEHQGEEQEGSVLKQNPPGGSSGRLFSLEASNSVWGRDKQMVTNTRSWPLSSVQSEVSLQVSHW